jgi:hypothetical protein
MTLTPETQPLQREMFTGQLVDNRSRYRKRLDKTLNQPQQMTMFSLKDTVALGVSARPWLKELPPPKLELECEDIRTEEEKERELLREAETLTSAMFAIAKPPDGVEAQINEPIPKPQRVKIPVSMHHPLIEGYRHRARRAKIRVRHRVL